jgi:hypothetical protein
MGTCGTPVSLHDGTTRHFDYRLMFKPVKDMFYGFW